MKKFINNSTKLIIMALLVISIPIGVTYASYKLNKLPVSGSGVEGEQTTKQSKNSPIQPIVYEEITVPGSGAPKITKLIDNSKKKSVFPNPKPLQGGGEVEPVPFPGSYPVAEKDPELQAKDDIFYDGKPDTGVTNLSAVRFNVVNMDTDNLKLENLNSFVAYDIHLDLYWRNSLGNLIISSYDIDKISYNGGAVFRKDSTVNSTPKYDDGIMMREKVTFTDINGNTYQYN